MSHLHDSIRHELNLARELFEKLPADQKPMGASVLDRLGLLIQNVFRPVEVGVVVRGTQLTMQSPVDDLELSQSALHHLKYNRLFTIGQLTQLSAPELRALPEMWKCFFEIAQELQRHNLFLRPSTPQEIQQELLAHRGGQIPADHLFGRMPYGRTPPNAYGFGGFQHASGGFGVRPEGAGVAVRNLATEASILAKEEVVNKVDVVKAAQASAAKAAPSRSAEYAAWQNVVSPTRLARLRAKVKGKLIEADWKDSFEAFLQTVGYKPDPKAMLVRRDRTKGWSKANTTWRLDGKFVAGLPVRRESVNEITTVRLKSHLENAPQERPQS